MEDKMRIRAKQIIYLKQYIIKHEADSTNIVEEDISISKLAVVPQSLPVFCEGNEGNKNVIRDIEEFADRFERVLRAHNLDLDNNWKRLLPLCLGKSEANWMDQYVLNVPDVRTWAQARDIVLGYYQSPIQSAMLSRE